MPESSRENAPGTKKKKRFLGKKKKRKRNCMFICDKILYIPTCQEKGAGLNTNPIPLGSCDWQLL